MRYLSLLTLLFLAATGLKAAPGDTTWVQAHSDVKLNYYNNFDTTVKFPDGTTRYRKVLMVFTLGKYNCGGGYDPARAGEPPTGTGWCADWDYTVQTFLMNKHGDSVELGRLITPYANTTFVNFPWTWKQPYYFDVTDYYPLLKDSNTIRVLYSGYSGGFTANIRFAMIEGTPDRDVLAVKRLWSGSFDYGKASDPIDNHTPVTSLTPPAGSEAAALRFTITGHGNDAAGCAEFCSRYYRVIKDGSMLKETSIWRNNCGANTIFPQSGTWLYNRGNWCPGDKVTTNMHPLPGITAGTPFNLNLNFQAYTAAAAGAIYTLDGAAIFYGKYNKSLDAGIEHVDALNDYVRTGFTTVRLHNGGSTVINNIDLAFGVSGKTMSTSTWTGTLAPLADTVIQLPVASSLLDATGSGNPYEVNIVKVNGVADVDDVNNKILVYFDAIPDWVADSLLIHVTTNNGAAGAYSQNEWRILDLATGAVVASRSNLPRNTEMFDTLKLPSGYYKLEVTDAACNGMSSWMYPGEGVGRFFVRRSRLHSFELKNYFNGDFGCGFAQYFHLVPKTTAISELELQAEAAMEVYPNPVNDASFTVTLHSSVKASGTIRLMDNTGKVILERRIRSTDPVQLPATGLSNGFYFVSFTPEQAGLPRLQQKLVIMK